MKLNEKINVYNMDCMEFMKDIQDNYYDLAIVDPPYGIKSQNDKRQLSRYGQNSFTEKPTQQYFNELFRITKNVIIWGANNFTLPETEYFIVWDKMQTVDNFASAEYAWTNCKMPAKVFRYAIHKEMQTRKKNGGKIHPTQKPIKLYEWLLDNYAKPDYKILDTHLGSGSSAIAAHYFNCEFDGIELDKVYFNAMVDRFKENTQQTKLF